MQRPARISALVLALWTASTLLASAQLRAPGPPALVQEFLTAYNADDAAAIQTFARRHFAAEALARESAADTAERLARRRETTGPLSYESTGEAGPRGLSVLLEGAGNRWYELEVRFAPSGSNAIDDLGIDRTLTPPAQPLSPKTRAGFVRAVDTYAAQLAKDGEFSGTILIAKDGLPLWAHAYGYANVEYAAPNRVDTRFNIGSIGKVFTMVAVLQLMQAGTISPNDTIGKWLPDYPNADAARRVTIAQLLAMRSGIGDFFGPEFAASPHDRIRTLRDYLPFFASKPLAFAPGTDSLYSNGGYLVLGLIVERASGKNYYAYVHDRIFQPARMPDTGYPEVDDVSGRRATGYTQADGTLRNAVYTAPARGSSGGGAYSTVNDLLAFTNALVGNRLLNESYTDWLLADFPPSGPTAGRPRHGGFGFAGGTAGANALLDHEFDSGYTIVVLANLDPPAAEAMARQIRQWSVEARP
jgi:CubicO group peptidase (beta-lactamase class C family)